ncbi:ketosynthase chain-length factor [Umezawaea endophytica]|uniref:Ketosynthase chain-length factor n=1 Tax=Umezawaea endophytica TaxID=1654476 RepID=A0A9X3A5U9_9PSEU|nr:ketosynthase chain-length factor [Umezawaea endophytica]MCS7484109.1 ketosynthase chain-length factor [Umezawaea endophytica]
MSAVVTGLGVVAPTGIGVERYWANTLAGRNGIAEITRFDASSYPVRLAGEVRDFDATEHLPTRLTFQTDRWTQFALCATEEALRDAGVHPLADSGLGEYEMAVVTASSSAGNEFGQRELGRLWSEGPKHVTAFQSIAWFYAATTGQTSIRFGMRGPCGVIASEQAGGLDALGQARRVLNAGAKLVVSGGTEAPLSPYALVCQQATGLLSGSRDAARAYLPFDPDSAGYLPGEGGAILIVEDEAGARERGAPHVYGRIAGYAATFDAGGGSELRGAAERALADAGIRAADVDVVFADAAGLPELDRAEADALVALFGPCGVPVSAPKTATGRLYAGGSSLDVAAALLTIRTGLVPPSVNVRPDSRYRVDLVVDAPRALPVRTALVIARGYGGFNAAVVVTAA